MLLLSKNFACSLLIFNDDEDNDNDDNHRVLIFLCCEWEHLYIYERETREAMRAKHAELWIKKERVVEFVNLYNKKKKKKRKEINQKQQESVYWLLI